MLHGIVDDMLEGHMPALAFLDAPLNSRGGTSVRTGVKRLQFANDDSKATERFCRAMIITDAVQVCDHAVLWMVHGLTPPSFLQLHAIKLAAHFCCSRRTSSKE